MDGGGRVAQPITAGLPGGSAARLASPTSLRLRLSRRAARLSTSLALIGIRRRSSVAVPLVRRIPRLAGTGLTLALFAAIGAYGVAVNGKYAEFKAHYGDPRDMVARALGFGLDKITISGIARLSGADVLEAAGIGPRNSLLFLSAAEVRDRLASQPAIKSVEVRKLYPDELAIALVERQPYALWQLNGELHVIAADGTAIDRLRDPSLAGLPLVVGEGANLRAPAYVALLEAAGPLRPLIRAGMLVSGRRWTLKMENGLDVRLPEEEAGAALARLIRHHGESGLLDKDVLAVDLRIPDRIILRLTEEAAAARAEAVKKKLQRGVKGIET